MTSPAPKPRVEFPEELPISARVRDIALAVDGNQVVIVAGETGSGKTTQLPKICLAMGRGLTARIGVTQPRRIAATSVAARVATELNVELGKEVGYQIRFANRSGPSTYVKFMTDGILLAELQGDPLLRAYDTIILDEAHERSLNIDFLLGYVKRLLPQRPDLRVIISSATLETDRFSTFFGGAPVVQVSGRTFPVEVIHRAPTREDGDLAGAIANTVEEITAIDPRGDILVFLPGEREIREAMDALTEHALPHTELLPLYGRLSQSDQARVFQRSHLRRVVLATNVAETSLTIPGIVYVVDSGLARVNRYVPRSGVTQLLVEPIARASADQRKGRAGRTQSGVAFRLYEQGDFDLRSAFTDPELLRVGLAGPILQMKSLGLGDIEGFPFLDPPPKRAVDEGYRVLEELGALDRERNLTEIGRKLARLPVDPRIGRMILAGEEEGALREVLILAAALGIQDPRERPLAQQKRADDAHRRHRDETSDFGALLKLWRFFHEGAGNRPQHAQRKLCRDNFLSYVRMREWIDLQQQLAGIAKELGFVVREKPATEEELHRALLPGLLSRVAVWNPEQRAYTGARQTKFQLHPSSGLAKKPPPWIVAAELVETSQLFGRTAARIDPTWLENAARALLKKSYGDASWSERAAQVMIKENISLYGLPVVRDRRVHLGPIDPAAARRIFIIHALVRQEYTPFPEPAFIAHNRGIAEEIKRMRDRARRGDLVTDEDAVAAFFEQRIPDGVYSGKTFETWRKDRESTEPRVLFLSIDDVLQGDAADLSPARFPAELAIDAAILPLTYRFDPSADDDGIAVAVPLALLAAIDPAVLEWTVPGWLSEQLSLLLHWLPRSHKRDLGSVDDLVATLTATLRPFAAPFRTSLAHAIEQLTGARIPPDAFDRERLPPHLRFHFRVVDDGRVLAEGRDLRALQGRLGARARDAWAGRSKTAWEKDGLTELREPLPDHVEIQVGGMRVLAFPGLVDEEKSIAQRLFPSRAAADEATRGGLRRLFLLRLATPITKLEQQIPARVAMSSFTEAGVAAPRRQIVLRAIDEAFSLGDPASFPRTRAAFDARFDAGKQRLAAAITELGSVAALIAAELDPVRSSITRMEGKPGVPRVALEDIRVQLQHMIGPSFFAVVPRARLAHVPRYLRAIQVRLERMPNGPQKDLAKAETVLPLWGEWLKRHQTLRSRGVPDEEVDGFRWLLEELRVVSFAPELKAAVSISPQRLAEQWRELVASAS